MPTAESPSDDDRAPTMSRRHAAGASSARGLLFTVLGEFVLPSGGAAWTSAFIDVLGRLGVEEKASRQALMRTANDGWLGSQRVGRRTRWSLTPRAESLLIAGTARIYGFTGPQRRWDGRWLVVLARVPETDRAARHLLRTRLAWAGLGSPAPGIWVSPHPDRITEVEAALSAAGLRDQAQIFRADHAGGGEPVTMARQAWDLEAIEARYEAFLAEFGGRTDGDPLSLVVDLVHAWRRFPLIDPALPRRLLPAGWSGARAAGLFVRRHAQWSPAARAGWLALPGSDAAAADSSRSTG